MWLLEELKVVGLVYNTNSPMIMNSFKIMSANNVLNPHFKLHIKIILRSKNHTKKTCAHKNQIWIEMVWWILKKKKRIW